MSYVLHDHASKRTCGSCKSWVREAPHPQQDKKGNADRHLVVANCRLLSLSMRGSDTCGKWTRHNKEAS